MAFSKFFSGIQEAPWYREFLDPVTGEIENKSKILDIGTGSGKLLQVLFFEKQVKGIGTDTSPEMLKEAAKKLKDTEAELIQTLPNAALPFENASFDYVTICNVLFLLPTKDTGNLLQEALRVLKEKGKIIVLSPTGSGGFWKLSKRYFSSKNLSIYIWYYATGKRAGEWKKKQHLYRFSRINKLDYSEKKVLNGFAQLEIVKK